MRGKLLNALAILTSLLGYLQWGNNHSMFLILAEWEVLSKLFKSPGEVFHPLTIFPLIGQILLLVTLFQKQPAKWLSYAGVFALGLLLGLMFFVGLIDLNVKIIASTIPFLVIAFFIFKHHKGQKLPKVRPV